VGPQSSESSLESRGKSVSFHEEVQVQTVTGAAVSLKKMPARQLPPARFGALKSALRGVSKTALHGSHQRHVVAS